MTGFDLKMIALLCMILDHVGDVFHMYTPEYFRWIGRIAFPIYAYLVAEGCTKTTNMNKYMLRLFFFALISEIPFDLAFMQPDKIFSGLYFEINFLKSTNVYYTLFLAALSIYAYERLKEKNFSTFIAGLPLVLCMLIAAALDTDYGMYGIFLIFAIYGARTKKAKLFIMTAWITFFYGIGIVFISIHTLISMIRSPLADPSTFEFYSDVTVTNSMVYPFALLAVLFVYFYNGQRGRPFKWIFYWAYPLHIIILANIWLLYVRPLIFD